MKWFLLLIIFSISAKTYTLTGYDAAELFHLFQSDPQLESFFSEDGKSQFFQASEVQCLKNSSVKILSQVCFFKFNHIKVTLYETYGPIPVEIIRKAMINLIKKETQINATTTELCFNKFKCEFNGKYQCIITDGQRCERN